MQTLLNIVTFKDSNGVPFDPSQTIVNINGYVINQTGLALSNNNPQYFIVDVNGVPHLCTTKALTGSLVIVGSNNQAYAAVIADPIVIGTCILIGGRKPHHP